MQNVNDRFIDTFKDRLRDILSDNLAEKKYYRITSPKYYDFSITQKIIEKIDNNLIYGLKPYCTIGH